MKTLNPGLSRTQRPWWAGQIAFCAVCRYSGELVPADALNPALRAIVGDGINGIRRVTIPCPNCGGVAEWDSGAKG
jgi:hypothetical protein